MWSRVCETMQAEPEWADAEGRGGVYSQVRDIHYVSIRVGINRGIRDRYCRLGRRYTLRFSYAIVSQQPIVAKMTRAGTISSLFLSY
jgi:hypothetical protein